MLVMHVTQYLRHLSNRMGIGRTRNYSFSGCSVDSANSYHLFKYIKQRQDKEYHSKLY